MSQVGPQAGMLRQRVNFQSPTVTKDDRGQKVTTWSDQIRNVPANVKKLHGRELEIAQMVQVSASWRIKIRYRPNSIAEKWRVLYGDRELHVVAISDINEERHTLEILLSDLKS